MAVELGSLTIDHLTHVSVREVARIETRHVPGMAGSLSQVMGRPSVEVAFVGIVYGETPGDELQSIRDAYLAQEPLGFFTESVGEGYFADVLIRSLEVSQRVSQPNELDFQCLVTEYVEPPEPAVADPFGGINTDLLDEATAFIDDVQNALEQVSQLTDLLTGFPDFADPTTRLGELSSGFLSLVGDNSSTVDGMGASF
jgi:hypothetical protein